MPKCFLVLYLLALLSTRSSPVYPVSFHYVLCVFWVEILGSRSTLSGQFLHYTRLTSGFASVLRVHRRSSCSPPLPPPRSVYCTRHQRWLPLLTTPSLCCCLFFCFCVVVFYFELLYCNLYLFIPVFVFEFFELFIHLLPP